MLPSTATSTYAPFFAPTKAACCAKQGSALLNGPEPYTQLCFLPWHAQSRSCWDSWVPWWAHVLIPALQQVCLNARRCFDARKRETACYLPLCRRRKVGGCVGDKHSGDQAGGSRCTWESRKEEKQRWLSQALTLLPLLAHPLLATHRHQMPASTPHLETRQMFYCAYIMGWKFFYAVKDWNKGSEWDLYIDLRTCTWPDSHSGISRNRPEGAE